MRGAAIITVLAMLAGCSSYGSIHDVRAAEPQEVTTIPLSFDEAYRNLVTMVNECHGPVRPVHHIRHEGTGEIAIRGSGPWVLLAIIMREVPDGTELALYWGNAMWTKNARQAKAWASGESTRC